jgi:GntR family transcriptional regulator
VDISLGRGSEGMKDGKRTEANQNHNFLKDLGINFHLDTESGIPFYRQIVQSVEHNIAVGALSPGDKLPTIRAFAIALKINPNTIAKAYTELEIRGLVKTQVGSGTYISKDQTYATNERERTKKKLEEICVELIRKAKTLGVEREEIISALKEMKDD